MSDKKSLGHFEEPVLLTIQYLGDEAYGASIRREVERALGRSISIGALYATLDRLERKGLISSRHVEGNKERDNRPKRYFKIERSGVHALDEARLLRSRLRRLVPVPEHS